MALSLSQVERSTVFGDRRVRFFTVTWDSSYATGGESLTAGDVGLQRIDFLVAEPAAASAGTSAHVVKYDYTNSKLQAFETGAAVDSPLKEATAAADLSATPCRIMVVGA